MQNERTRTKRARLRPHAWIMVVAGALTLISWALASAPGSAPDDNYHMASIWCFGDGSCPTVPGEPSLRRPPAEVPAAPCFSQDSDISAGCQEGLSDDMLPGKATGVGNWNTDSYPPLFYATMHLLITGDLYSSTLLMRVFNGVLLTVVIGSLIAALPRRLKPLGAVPILITSVPLGMTLFASTNPSSWAIAGSAVVWPALYAAFEVRGRRRVALLALFVVGVLMASGSRGDAALFTIGGIGLVLLMRWKELLANKTLVVVAAAGLAISAWFFLTSGQATVVVSGGFGIEPKKVLPWHQIAVANLQQLPVLWAGSLGFGFMASAGWLDTPFPALVGFSATTAWAVYVFGSWREMFPAKVFAVSGVGVAMILYPLVMLGLSGAKVGTGFQPRYLLPLLVILTGVSMLSRRVVASPFTRFQAVLATAALGLAQSLALHTQIRRYVTGLDVGGINLDRGREWWWDLPISATATWVAGSLAFAILAWYFLRPSGLLGSAIVDEIEREMEHEIEETGRREVVTT
ncbi:DUF2142 domain-containing protein [Nocardioides iriomotensis]|uniref:DUF2142 domain-containing protein n=1 Tax=Nocardioides iriomotensis TaxID=715784 RepID=A0A4Q5J7F5_9ACTN|nr:DUF2142 domain-containing protein [Nocardioides iriomotensis]RYU14494.1 DUF2142 domain-containing protein [Nocardioides iriomotensis]